MKAIVVYYSYSGNTKNIAEHIAKELGADTAVIDTVTPYEGDYNAVVDQGQDEIRRGYKPPIKPVGADLSQYDTIILGTPASPLRCRLCGAEKFPTPWAFHRG